MLAPEQQYAELAAIQQATDRPYNVNFFCHTSPEPDPARENAWRDALAPHHLEFGIDPAIIPAPPPTRWRACAHEAHLILSSATTVEEGRRLEAHSVDAVIARCLKTGGHRGLFLTDQLCTQLGTFALLPQLVATLKGPVVAAGDIASAAEVRAAMVLSAAGVQIGTSYRLADKASTSPIHRVALGDAKRRGSGEFLPLWCDQNATGCRHHGVADQRTSHLVLGHTALLGPARLLPGQHHLPGMRQD